MTNAELDALVARLRDPAYDSDFLHRIVAADAISALRDRLDAAEKLSEERRVLLARTLAREVEVEKRAERAEAERDEAHRILREVNAELARLYTVRDELMTRAEKAEAECLRLNHAEAEAMSVVLSNEGQIDALRHDLARAQETATTLATENEALRRDAERYRWLRGKTQGLRDHWGKQSFILPTPNPVGDVMRGSLAEHFDAAIDAAIAASKSG